MKLRRTKQRVPFLDHPVFSPLPFLRGLELRPLGSAGNSPASLLYCANGNGVYGTALRNGSMDTVLRKRLRKRMRMNGNVRLETRHKSSERVQSRDQSDRHKQTKVEDKIF